MENLTREEYGRFLKLEEICPQDDLFDLYEAAAPHLKADETFNGFLNEIMGKKFMYETEEIVEEKEMKESLLLASTSHVPPQKNVKSILKKGQDNNCEQKKVAISTDWDMEKELEMILYGNASDTEPNGSGKIRDDAESDSDESFHSLEGELENKNLFPEKVLRETKNTNCSSFKNFIFQPLKEEIASEENFDLKEIKKFTREDITSLGKEANPEKNFASFNELIKEKKDGGLNLKPNEKKKEALSCTGPSQSTDPMSRMIDCFFFQPEESPVNDESHCETRKAKNFASQKSISRHAASMENSKALAQNSACNSVSDLEIPGYPFVYVVSETSSPAFLLPKGNYLITNTIPSVEALGPGFKVLHHPSNSKGHKIDISNKKFERKKSKITPSARDIRRPTVSLSRRLCRLEDSDSEEEENLDFVTFFNQGLSNGSLNDFSSARCRPFVTPVAGRTGRTEKNHIDDDDDNSSEDSFSTVMAALRISDPDYIKRELENCGHDVELQKKIIEREVERSRRSDIETQRIRDGWEKILKELPQRDPEYLLNKWTEIAGDDPAIDALIQEEKVKIQLEDIKNRLFSNLPLLDRKYLESKANDFLFDQENLQSFIAEEKKKMIIDQQYCNMLSLLPYMDPVLLREKCEEFQGDNILVDSYIRGMMLEEERNNQITSMHLIIPDAEPGFLEEKYQEFPGNAEAFNNFLFGLLESKEYPKVKKDDPAYRERAGLWRRFVDNFSVQDLLDKIPDPEEHYASKAGDKTDMKFVTKFLQSRYPDADVQLIERTFQDKNSNLTNACAQLDDQFRAVEIMDESFRNETIPESFLLEMVFILRRREIREYLRAKKESRDLRLAEARIENSLWTCSCCYEDELLENEVTACPEGHIVCVKCVTRYVVLKLGEGVTKFTCTTDECGTEFILAILEKILPRNLYIKVLRKKQSAEVTEAGVPGLESCPSCDFAYIPNENDKIFSCQNPDCMRETCRKCQEENHVPLRCEEIEKPKDTKVRKEIEEKMTEALLRTCYQCGKKFIRNTGCNRMTCVCGAAMCYICRRPGVGCACPAYNDNELHTREVRTAGETARDQALRENPDVNLVHDPVKTL